jgi:ectoine hydroxylase-related dioxygenase (phytanoyl-CoA dioxygenase family)
MRFATDGVELFPDFLRAEEVDALVAAFPAAVAGQRSILWQNAAVRALAVSAKMSALLQAAGVPSARPVRAIFFDKNPAKNWAVPWHQDVAIAVARRIDTPGFHGWSMKDGVPHVQPPAEYLARMVTVRLHLDDCPAANGALRVIPGSHRHGLLAEDAIARLPQSGEQVCELARGGALLMRPLLLHASSRASRPAHRRIVHIEYSPDALPNGLEWFDAPAPEVSLS